MISIVWLLVLAASCLCQPVVSNGTKEGLRNKHLVIAGEYWSPFLMYDYDANWTAIEGTYSGVMWDLLLFMQKARNFTFTIVGAEQYDYEWGSCHEVDNCTGMIGMVNRKEVDFALGPFNPTYMRSKSVDFSTTIKMQPYNIVIPVRTNEDLWSFVNPFAYQVWICAFASIPAYIFAMVLAEYLCGGMVDWQTITGFVFRNAFHENMRIPDRETYRKLLIITWVIVSFVVSASYAGNLSAMLTNPKLSRPITKPEDLLNQAELSWVVEDGVGAVEYMSASPPGSTWRRIYEKIEKLSWEEGDEEWPSGCFSYDTTMSRKHASICDIDSIKSLLHYDFSENAQCDWYITDNTFFEVSTVMVFQVWN